MGKTKTETAEQKANREMVEKIAGNIQSLADSVRSLLNGPLNRRALVILLAASARLPQVQVESVLKALESLDKDWLNKK